jgi:hypothetical protein
MYKKKSSIVLEYTMGNLAVVRTIIGLEQVQNCLSNVVWEISFKNYLTPNLSDKYDTPKKGPRTWDIPKISHPSTGEYPLCRTLLCRESWVKMSDLLEQS